jgi:hypothetical protein
MSQEIINNGEQGFAIRTKINNNFTETYTNILSLSTVSINSKANTLATNKLLGRYTVNSGPCEEISLGTGLSFNSGILDYTLSKTIARFTASDGELNVGTPATLGSRGTHPVLDFNDTTQNTAVFRTIVPNFTNFTTGLYVFVYWVAAATTGTVGWDVSFERITINTQNLNSDNFETAVTIPAVTVPSTAGVLARTFATFSLAQLPTGLVSGDMIRVRIRRDVANDNAIGDAEIVGVEIQSI